MKKRWILRAHGDGWNYVDNAEDAERFHFGFICRSAARRCNRMQRALNLRIPLHFVAEHEN